MTDLPDLRRRPCYGGLDMASSDDLASFALFWPEHDGRRPFCRVWSWCPVEQVSERERRHEAHYRQWVDDGWLLTTEGNRIDHDAIRDHVADAFAEFDLVEIGFDPWNADSVVNPLLQAGYNLVQIPQTVGGLANGTRRLLDLIEQSAIDHEADPVLEWALGNCSTDELGDAVKFSKKKSPGKIDPAQALAMAVGRWLAPKNEPSTPGVW